MKLETAPQDVAVHGDFETTDFAIGDISFIVDMFADKVYSHKERAIIRELSCNAHDSHVIAGTTDVPFEVHLPTALESWFSIRDYGTGLSDEDVRNIFAGIGISTKRDSNEVIGCFGIGSLSPYALTDSFNVKSYMNGVVRHYNCYRDENRKPVVALLTEMETDEPNGLEVSLTIEDRASAFEDEAEYVYRFWEGTLPDINNKYVVEACESQRDEYKFKGDDFGLSNGYGNMFAIMGNIAYKIPDEIPVFNGVRGYLKFELGELEFDTARENLSMTDKVKTVILNKIRSVKEKLADIAIQQIEAEPTPFKRAMLVNSLEGGRLGTYIKGDLKKYYLPEPKECVAYWTRHWSSTDKGRSNSVPVGDNVEYYEYKDRMTTRIRSYIKDHNKLTMVILSPGQADECKIDRDVIKDLDDLPKVARVGGKNGSTIKTFRFDETARSYCDKKGRWDAVTLDLDGDEIVYIEISRWEAVNGCSNYSIKRMIEDLKTCGVDVEVHGLKSAFLKTKAFRGGNFIEVHKFLHRELKRVAPASISEYDVDQYDKIKAMCEAITSPELAEWREMTTTKESAIEKICKKHSVEMEKDTFLQDWQDEFFEKYPMLDFVSSWEISKNSSKVANYINGEVK